MISEHYKILQMVRTTMDYDPALDVITFTCPYEGDSASLASVGRGGRFAEAGIEDRRVFTKKKIRYAEMSILKRKYVDWIKEKIDVCDRLSNWISSNPGVSLEYYYDKRLVSLGSFDRTTYTRTWYRPETVANTTESLRDLYSAIIETLNGFVTANPVSLSAVPEPVSVSTPHRRTVAEAQAALREGSIRSSEGLSRRTSMMHFRGSGRTAMYCW